MSKISSYWIKHQLWQCYARKPSLSRAQWVRKLVPVLLEVSTETVLFGTCK